MAVRETFQGQIDDLKQSLIDMGSLSTTAINNAIDAANDRDVTKSLEIIDNDYKINLMEDDVNDRAILMIAKQQPVASDLRNIIVAIKIATDIERIGDLAVNIAKSTIRIANEDLVKPLEDIPKMANIAVKMVSDSLKAYYEEDVVLAKSLADTDDIVDKMYGELIQELMQLMSKNPDTISQVTQLAFICRFLERVADHSTNIAENVIYLVKGKRYGLND